MAEIRNPITQSQLKPSEYAYFYKTFMNAMTPQLIWEQFADKITIPTGEFDTYKIEVWDDIAWYMNYKEALTSGGRQNGLAVFDNGKGTGLGSGFNGGNASNVYQHIDINPQNYAFDMFDLTQGGAIGTLNLTNYKQYIESLDTDLVGKDEIEIPIQRFFRYIWYDKDNKKLIPNNYWTKITEQLGRQAGFVIEKITRLQYLTQMYPVAPLVVTINAANPNAGLTDLADAISTAIARLRHWQAPKYAKMIEGSVKQESKPVKDGYYAIIHPDLEKYLKNMPGFIDKINYGDQSGTHKNEFGAFDQVRFISNEVLAWTGNPSDPDIYDPATGRLTKYTLAIFGEGAFASTTLRGTQNVQLIAKDINDPADAIATYGWKAIYGATVTRPVWTYKIVINLTY